MIAHSRGGGAMAKIIGKFSDYVIEKVKYVAFTDGVQRDFDLYLNQNI